MALTKEDQERIKNRWQNRNNGSSTTTSGGTSTGTSLLSDKDKERFRNSWSKRFDVDDTYINTFISDANSFLNRVQTDYNKLDYKSATAESSLDYYNSIRQTESDLGDRAWKVQNYLKTRKDDMDEETYNSMSSYLDNFSSPKFSQKFYDARDFYSKWESEDEYKAWQAEQEQYEADKTYDVNAGMLELEELKKERDAWLAEQEEKRKQAESEESFWDSLGRWLGTTPDTTIPLAGASTTPTGNSSANVYDKQIADLEAKIERSKYVQGYEGYMGNMGADDYAANSQYISTRSDVPMEDATYYVSYGVSGEGAPAISPMYDKNKLFGDFLYDYINRNPDALDVAKVNDTSDYSYFLGHDKGFLQTMKDEEIGVFNYLYNTKGPEAANEFLSHIESDLEGRRRAQEQAFWAAYAKEDPVGSSVFSTLITPLKGLSYVGQAADMLDDGKMDQNAGYNRFSYIPSSIRSQVSTTIENSGKWGKVGSFAYNTGMSMADFLFTTAVSGGNQALSLAVMGSGAAADATIAAKDRGLDDGQAFTLGTIAGLAEVAMEKISLGAWLEGDMTEGALKYVLKNALSEGGEEAGTSIVNLLADVIIAGDKSEWNVAMQAYIDEGKTPEEAFGLVAAEQAAQIGLDALGGMLSGAAIGGGTYAGTSAVAGVQYGNTGKNKVEAQKLVSEGLELNPNSQYIQKMQGKVEKGKNLSGMQVRNILAANQEQITANDLKKIQQAAEKRLTVLGQTKNVAEVAEIATKWATGQEITRAEKKLLTHSEYGSRVANELLPENIASDNYSTAWAEEIGTKQVNAAAYNKKAIRNIIDAIANAEDPNAYKSLESRVDGETPAKVSDTGKSVIRATGEEIDLTNPSFKQISDEGVVLDVNGKPVRSNEIDYDTEEQGLAISSIGKIEHITPAAASALYAKLDMTKPVMGQLNGMDEAFTYGFYNYSEADLEAGLFTGNLTKDQLKDAYNLGRYVAKNGIADNTAAIKKMRTAADALAEKNAKEGKETPKSQKLTITYNHGNGIIEDIETAEKKLGKLHKEQRAGIEVAKILHQMGIGTSYEFFKSEYSKTLKDKEGNPLEVFLNDEGQEEAAYAGIYLAGDGKIRINLNAYSGTKGLTLNALSHELTHFIKTWSLDKYTAMAEFLVKSYGEKGVSMHQLVLKEQARLEKIRGQEVGYGEAYDEVVANAFNRMLEDGKVMDRIAEIRQLDKSLGDKIIEGIKKFIKRFMNVYQKNQSLFKETEALMEMKEVFEQLQNMFAEALVEASDNFQASQTIGFEMDVETESVSPAVMHSEQTWTESDYVQQRDKAAQEIAKAIGVSKKKAKDYIDSINSIAKMIAEDRSRLDYFSSPGRTSFVGNVEYGGSFDFSTLCKKRRLLTGTFTAIQKALPNTALTADEILDIRNRMKKANLEVSCGLCYVEGSRANMGQFSKEFLRLYKQYYPDAWQPNMADVNTPDGIEWVRINHPECYEQYEYFWNHYGTLKDGDKNLFASQQKPKLYQLHTEYKGEILDKFKNDDNVEEKNLNGGIRLQSFSDFEIVHLIDTMQIIMDMSRVGLAGQAYTKVPDFAWALGDTGLKINLSLIAKGVDANGKLIFDDVEGMPIAEAMKLRDRYSKNVGTILVAFNDEQLLAAMADDRVDFIIPFHRSQWKKSQYEAMGLPAKTKDYTFMQNEKYIKPQFHEYRGRMVKDKAINYMPNEYWDFSKTGKENAEAYLEMCARNNKRPKFYKLLQNNGDGSYSLKADGSTDGYWKLLIDFKMYDNEGNGSPQMAVKPDFNMEEATRMLNDYSGGHSNFPVAQGIVDGFVKDYKASHKGEQYSSQETDIDTNAVSAYDGGKKETEQEVKGNEKRKETRESFLGRAGETSLEVGERGSLAFGFRQYSGQLSQNIQAAEKELKNLGIPVVVFEHMEGNKDGTTTIYSNDALSIPGVAVFIHKDATLDAVEIVGHEGYHYLRGSDNRIVYREVVAENIEFSSKAIIDYQKKYVGDSYFSEDVVFGSKEWDTLMEELFAYITGHIHAGDPKGEVHKFLRDYDAVKAAWDDLIKKQATQKGQQYSSQQTDLGNAPTFYSQMGKVVEGMKQDKFGASSVISMLRGRGVKAEEIRWSGIQAFLDGKKSVTKQELLDFINSSMLHIEEETRSVNKTRDEFVQAWRNFVDQDLDENEILAGLDNLGEMESYLESLVEDEDLDRYYADYILDIAKKVGNSKYLPTKWDQYKLDGGENYRELVFKMPGSTYTNTAMQTHWGADAQGVLAHARIQDFNTFIGKMLFIEEIQSDWHNAGHKAGYRKEGEKTDNMLYKESEKAYEEFYTVVEKLVYDNANWEDDNAVYYAHPVAVAEMFEGNESYFDQYGFTEEQRATIRSMVAEEAARQAALKTAPQQDAALDAPFKKNYHEYVLKRLLRMAAEEGYDSIGWTTAETQDDRWQNNLPHKEGTGKSGFLKAYTNEYDQRIKGFLEQFGNQWGTTVGKTTLDNGTEVWSMAITDSMQKSVLKEGQAMYSTQQTDNITDRDMLANAFETISKSSAEYLMIQDYKSNVNQLNKLERELDEVNQEIRKIRFGTGEYDGERLKLLDSKANRLAKEITRYDKRLLNMEASAPLRRVIQQERKKEAQRTRDHVKEIQQNKKLRAEQTELRHKIRKAVRDLDKILNRGNKKLNVKEDMKGFVSKALELADYLFTDHISNDELIRNGIDADLVTASGKAQLVKETEEILTKLYDEADSLTDEEFTRLDAKRKANEERMKDLLTAQRNRRLDVPVYNLFNDLVIEYASLKNSSQDAVKAAYSDDVERLLRTFIGDVDSDRAQALKNMRVADMTTEELWKLYNAYTMVLTTVRDANKFHAKGMNESIEQVVGQIAGDFGSRKIPEKKIAIALQKIGNKIGWDYEKLYYALDRIGSEAFTKLIMNLADSENIVMQDIIEAVAFRDQIVEKYGFNNWEINKEIDREFMDNSGKKFKLTLGQMMSLYAYSRREGAWDHIEYGGFVFGEAALTNPKPADSYKLSKAQCEAITSLLTKEQKAYVEDMQKFLSETMGGKGNEVSMQLYGIKMFGEKNYFPIHIAGQFKAQAQESQAKQAAGFGSMSNAGFTHAQNPNAKAPFVLEGFNEVWSDHVNEMSRYHGTVPALEDLRRVMNRSTYSDSVAESQSIKQLMENHFGKEAVEYFDNLYREANSGAITDKLQHKSKKLLSLFRKNSVAYSLSVLIQQPASLVRAYALIDKKHFGFKGVGTITSGIAKAVSSKWNPAYANAYNEMLKYAPGVTMAKEIGGFDTATGSSIRSTLLDTGKSLKQKWDTGTATEKGKAVLDLVDNNAIANLPNVADKIAWIEIWNACKRETVTKHKDLTPGSEEFMQAVGDRFTEVIRATQVYDSIFAKSPMLKSKNLAVQYLVSFMNEPNTVANMAEKAVRDATKGDWKSGVKTAAVVVHSIIFTNVLKSMIYALRDDDEDETYIEKYIEAIAGGMMDDFNALNYIPLVRDAWSVALGYDVERADTAIVADAVDALGKVIKNAATDKEGMTEDELVEFDKKVTDANWKLVESLAAFFGIPVKNVRREIEGVMDHARIAHANAGQTTALRAWDKVYEAVVGSIPFMSTPSKQDKLYDAIISGDKAYLGRIKSTYKTEDAYQSAVRKALRENDPRIKEAAQAHINGDPSERVRIAKLIIADGFDQDDVVMAINAEINDMTPDDSSSNTTKAKGLYKTEDFVREYANGDGATLGAIREDIIDTDQKNGKTLEEAEKDFASDVRSKSKDVYLEGSLDDTTAEKLLVEYADMDEEEAASRVNYWSFIKEYPEYDYLSESNVEKYHEFAEPADISVEVYAQFITGTKGLTDIKDKWGDVEVTKREQVLEVIDSLPLTWQQKDALYLAAGYSENKIWDVPW